VWCSGVVVAIIDCGGGDVGGGGGGSGGCCAIPSGRWGCSVAVVAAMGVDRVV
jgi:hypothetical protein